MTTSLPIDTIIGGNWKVERFLGEGACAKVYEVSSANPKLNHNLGYDMVAKVIPLPGQKLIGSKSSKKEQERICNTLSYEYTLYTGLLYGFQYCPRNPSKFYGEDNNLKVRYLVMERLDQDLVSFSKQSIPTPCQVAEIGLQILDGLKWLHAKTFLFVDVKPDNFMMKAGKVYFVDFGLTERVQDNPSPGQVAFNGTPTFSSLSADQGNALSYRDDVEALGYVLLSLYSGGKLPWSDGATTLNDLIEMKKSIDIIELATRVNSPELGTLISHCRQLPLRTKPNYDLCISLLHALKGRKRSVTHSSTALSCTKSTSKSFTTSNTEAVEIPNDLSSTLSQGLPTIELSKVKITAQRTKKATNDNVGIEVSEQDQANSSNRKRKGNAKSVEKSFNGDPCRDPIATAANIKDSIIPTKSYVIDVVDPSIEGRVGSLIPDESRKSRRIIPRASSFGVAVGPFSTNEGETMVSRPPRKVPVDTVKVNLISPNGDSIRHEFRCPTSEREFFYFIGSDKDCDLPISCDRALLPKHLKLRITADEVSIMDEGSNDGTQLNGLLIPRKRWKAIDIGYSVVSFGNCKMEF